MKRSLVITSPAKLSTYNNSLKITTKEKEGLVPFEDIGYVIIEHYQTTITQSVLGRLAECGAVLYVCSEKHMPIAYALPMYAHTESSLRIQNQINCSEPLRKSIWQQLIKQKLINQAEVLLRNQQHASYRKLMAAAKKVLPGDTDNKEAYGAAVYWKSMMPDNIQRDYDGSDLLNARLNYGYAILRGAVARAIVSAGLLPNFGVHHRNKYNPYCLADDLMEPFRPIVDELVYSLPWREGESLNKEDKGTLVQVLTKDVLVDSMNRVMMSAINSAGSSLAHVLLGEKRKLILPRLA